MHDQCGLASRAARSRRGDSGPFFLIRETGPPRSPNVLGGERREPRFLRFPSARLPGLAEAPVCCKVCSPISPGFSNWSPRRDPEYRIDRKRARDDGFHGLELLPEALSPAL